jgi:3-hydroxybutyryl-CoA dehydratase
MSVNTAVELYQGMQETFSKVITEGETALYAGLVGDNRAQVQAVTRDGEYIPPRSLVHPQFLVGIIGGLLNTRIPGEGSQCITMQYEFLAPIYCGNRIDTVIELTAIDTVKHLATFRINSYNHERVQVITGQVIMLVPVQSLR